MSKHKLKFWLKLIITPGIFVWWVIYRLSKENYVDSPTFEEYWSEL